MNAFLKRALRVPRRLDYRLFWLINGGLHNPLLDASVRLVNRLDVFLGNLGKVVVILLAVGLWAWHLERPRFVSYFLLVSAVILAQVLVSGVLKVLLRERRPLFVFGGRVRILSERKYGYSMPSGHTQVAFAIATLLSARSPRYAVLYYLAASLIGLYRIYVGAHFPSDVLAGAILGIGLTDLLLRLLPFP